MISFDVKQGTRYHVSHGRLCYDWTGHAEDKCHDEGAYQVCQVLRQTVPAGSGQTNYPDYQRPMKINEILSPSIRQVLKPLLSHHPPDVLHLRHLCNLREKRKHTSVRD